MARWVAVSGLAEQVDVDATAGGVGLTAASAKNSKAQRAFCTVETAQIRIQTDPGVTLTQGGSEGSPIMNPGDSFYIHGTFDMQNFKAIATGATSGALNVIYEGTVS